jgi:hypothetical protein
MKERQTSPSLNSSVGSRTFQSGHLEHMKRYIDSLVTTPTLVLIPIKLTRAWSVFWNALSFNPDIPLSQSLSFKSRISELLQLSPPNFARIAPGLKLKVGLMDLEGLDIKVRPTLNIDEHMTLEEDTLRILKLTRESWNLCLTYHENLVAK